MTIFAYFWTLCKNLKILFIQFILYFVSFLSSNIVLVKFINIVVCSSNSCLLIALYYYILLIVYNLFVHCRLGIWVSSVFKCMLSLCMLSQMHVKSMHIFNWVSNCELFLSWGHELFLNICIPNIFSHSVWPFIFLTVFSEELFVLMNQSFLLWLVLLVSFLRIICLLQS